MASTAVDVEDLLVRVKNGDDAELAAVAREVAALAEEGRLGDDDDDDGLLVPALLVRLAAAGTAEARVSVMAALRRLAGCVGSETKVRHRTASLCSSLPSPYMLAHALCSMLCSPCATSLAALRLVRWIMALSAFGCLALNYPSCAALCFPLDSE